MICLGAALATLVAATLRDKNTRRQDKRAEKQEQMEEPYRPIVYARYKPIKGN